MESRYGESRSWLYKELGWGGAITAIEEISRCGTFSLPSRNRMLHRKLCNNEQTSECNGGAFQRSCFALHHQKFALRKAGRQPNRPALGDGR